MRYTFLRFLVFGFFVHSALSNAHGDDTHALLSDISQHYLRGAEAIREISLRFSTTAVDPQNANVIKSRSETRIARKGTKVYSERIRDAAYANDHPASAHTGMAYDGTDTRSLAFTDQGAIFPGYHPDLVHRQDEFLGVQGYPVAGGGLIVPSLKKLLPCNLAELLQPEGEVSLSINENHVIATAPGQRLTLDRTKHFALIKREVFEADVDSPIQVHIVSDFFEIAPSMWIGRTIDVEMRQDGVVTGIARVQLLDSPVMTVPDDLFVFKFPPKIMIADYRQNMQASDSQVNPKRPYLAYQVPTDPADLERVAADAKARARTVAIAEEKGMTARLWLLVINIGIVVVALMVFGYSRMSK